MWRKALHIVRKCLRKSDNKGFTIIEILVAVVILGLAYVAILQNFSVSLKNLERINVKKTDMFGKLLRFESLLLELRSGEEVPELGGEIFLEGRVYQLVRVADENNEFVTLILERL